MDINQFRQQYPEYNDIDDKTLSNKLYNKYYSDLPKQEFENKFLGTPTGKVTKEEKIETGLELKKEEVKNKSLATSIKEAFYNRPTFQALGGAAGVVPSALAGAGVGSVAGPIGSIVGGVTGGVLGGLAGGQVYDITQGLLTGERESVPEQYKKLGKDLKSEVAFNLAGAAIPGIGPAIRRGLGGATKAAKEIFQAGERAGIPQSLVTASDSALVQTYNKALGVFPFTGSPIRAEAGTRAGLINKKAENILNELGPNVSISDLGVDLTNAAKQSYSGFKKQAASLYDDFLENVEQLPNKNIIKLDNTKQAIKLIEDEIVKPYPGFKNVRSDAVLDYLRQIKNIEGNIDPQVYRSLQKDLGDLFKKGQVEGLDVKRLTKVKKALEKDFSLPVIRETGVVGEKELIQNVLDSHQAANEFYAEGMAKFSSPIAKKFKQVNKNIFGAGAEIPGTISSDELAKKVIKVGSPQSISQLKNLVGQDEYKKIASRVINDAFDTAVKESDSYSLKFNVDTLMKELGLVGKKKENVQGIKELLKATNVSFDDFSDFLTLAKVHEDTYVPNAAEFLKRRFAIGGGLGALAGVGGAVGGAAGIINAPLVTLGIIYSSVLGSKLIANPKNLKLANTLLDFKSPRMIKFQAGIRALDQLISDKDTPKEEKEGLIKFKEELKGVKDQYLKQQQ